MYFFKKDLVIYHMGQKAKIYKANTKKSVSHFAPVLPYQAPFVSSLTLLFLLPISKLIYMT